MATWEALNGFDEALGQGEPTHDDDVDVDDEETLGLIWEGEQLRLYVLGRIQGLRRMHALLGSVSFTDFLGVGDWRRRDA
jgi:hypothetical protein